MELMTQAHHWTRMSKQDQKEILRATIGGEKEKALEILKKYFENED